MPSVTFHIKHHYGMIKSIIEKKKQSTMLIKLKRKKNYVNPMRVR